MFATILDMKGVYTEDIKGEHSFVGVSNGHKKISTARKLALCSICSQNLDECSLALLAKFLQLLACSESRKNLLDFLKFRKSCKACYVRIEHPKYCVVNSSNSTPPRGKYNIRKI